MLFDLEDDYDIRRAKKRFNELLEAKCIITLQKKRKKRTIKQNKYLHVLFSLFGIEFGLTLSESKQIVKSNCPFMMYEKKGQHFIRSTAELDTKEMSKFIDWFMDFAGQQGCYLPTADEYNGKWAYFEKIIENHSNFL